ncbi:MAG TPA: MIP/aquaporin family protein [Microthrixaceae bacterium]|nr:MIP/aquaporin family protein [Microthrixaceae bacterium]
MTTDHLDTSSDTRAELGVPAVRLDRRLAAEFVGTALLVAIVVGSGIAAQRLTTDTGLQLLANSIATGAGLVALILSFASVSGARFNPLVSLAAVIDGDLDRRDAVAEVSVQVAGGVLGAIVANLMFELPAIEWSTHTRSSGGLWLGEIVATSGLLLVVIGTARSPRLGVPAVAAAVGGYITAAYWFTSSTSFANPAVTVARMFSDTFAGIEPASVPAFLVAQVVGAALAIILDRYLHPRSEAT